MVSVTGKDEHRPTPGGVSVGTEALLHRLDGVDLSAEMLAVARERGIYRKLIEADITEPLALLQGLQL